MVVVRNVPCWPEWTDCLGQIFRPGDYVAYAGMSYKSAQLTVGQVDRINRYRADGSEITNGQKVITPGHRDPSGKWIPSVYGAPIIYCSVRIIPLVKNSDGIWGHPEGRWVNGQYESPLQMKPKTLLKVHHIVKLDWTPVSP